MSNKLPTYGVNSVSSPTSTPTRPAYTVAAGTAPGLDELLDQMPSKWKLVRVGGPYPHGYVALFRDTTNHRKPLDHSDFLNGTGPTRMAAIANAVARAAGITPGDAREGEER